MIKDAFVVTLIKGDHLKPTELHEVLSQKEKRAVTDAMNRTVVISGEDYLIVSLRTIRLLEEEELTSTGILFFLKGDKTYFLVNNSMFEIERQKIYKLMLDELKNIRFFLNFCSEQIDSLEDELNVRHLPRHFLDTCFKMRRDLAFIDRAFIRNAYLMKQIRDDYIDLLDLNLEKVSYALEFLEIDVRNCQAETSRLTNVYSFYTSLKAEKMNQNIYLLALISGVFLPLNLLVGFFGMNTQNLFFADNPMGTKYVLWILFGVFAVLILGLPLIRVFDQVVLYRIFGRSKMYKTLNEKISSLNPTNYIKP